MSDKTTLTLPENFDISQAKAVKERMEKSLAKDVSKVDVKADSVDRADSASIQLLLSFQNAVIDSGKEFTILKPSNEFLAAIEILGATKSLGLE